MKGGYVNQEKDHLSHSTMFAKLHPPQNFHHHHHHPPPPPPQQLPPPPGVFNHPPFNSRECQTSEEVESQRSPTSPSTTTITTANNPDPSSASHQQQQIVLLQDPSSGGGEDGMTLAVVRRPRGRPPGSKNKPKPPVIITRDTEHSMSPYILEVSAGVDVLETIMTFCRKRNTGLCILNGSGTVSNVTLRQPSTTPGASVTFHGRFDILSLSATILPPTNGYSGSGPGWITNGIANGFTISIAGPQGQVVGGTVMGPLYTAGTVFLVAATFNSPLYNKLPLEEDRVQSGPAAAGGSSAGNEGRHPSPSAVSGGGEGGGAAAAGQAVDSSCGGVSMYNSCQMNSDVIWAPTARQPQHPPY